jgi:hypothetical protein
VLSFVLRQGLSVMVAHRSIRGGFKPCFAITLENQTISLHKVQLEKRNSD